MLMSQNGKYLAVAEESLFTEGLERNNNQSSSCISVNGFVDFIRIYIPCMLRNTGRYSSIMEACDWPQQH